MDKAERMLAKISNFEVAINTKLESADHDEYGILISTRELLRRIKEA